MARKLGNSMQRSFAPFKPVALLWRALALSAGALAGLGAAVIAAILAVFFAATMVVAAFMASILLALAAASMRARRRVRAPGGDADLIEARHVGGHSWVAYGWDGRR
jgi:hypothetical protein